jgi:hypothetical protein
MKCAQDVKFDRGANESETESNNVRTVLLGWKMPLKAA